MTREELQRIFPILQAFKDGKVIQEEGLNGKWYDVSESDRGIRVASLVLFPESYRVKPEPKERE